jgi:hypothetical protein
VEAELPQNLNRDTPLQIVRLGLTGLLGLSIIVGAGAVALIVFMLAQQDKMSARLASSHIDSSAIWWLVCMLALIAGVAALVFVFVRRLRAIVQSVSRGDPFVPVNADRLRQMAWLTLAIQLLAIPMTRLVVWFDAAPQTANVYHNRNGISFGGLMLAVILFILARVFRQGTRLREEVEGTV